MKKILIAFGLLVLFSIQGMASNVEADTFPSRTTMKLWFQKGSKPLATQFAQIWDSFYHLGEDTMNIDDIPGLPDSLAAIRAVAESGGTPGLADSITAHRTDLDNLQAELDGVVDTVYKLNDTMMVVVYADGAEDTLDVGGGTSSSTAQIFEVAQTGHGYTSADVGKLVYLTGANLVQLASADFGAADSVAQWAISRVVDANNLELCNYCFVTLPSAHGITQNSYIWLGPTPGTFLDSVTNGRNVQFVGKALGTENVYFEISDISGSTVNTIDSVYFSNDSIFVTIGGASYYIGDTNIDSLQSLIGAKADTSVVYKIPADYVTPISYSDSWEKMPNFFDAFINKREDCDVVLIGTSITQGTQYAGYYPDASTRPIYCESYNLASLVFDRLRLTWDHQYYRRYDSGYFTETGTWANKTSDATWDDTAKRVLTRSTTTAAATLAFEIPIDAWTFRFVYKSETGGDTITVSVAEGNGFLQVWDSTAWIEANGFKFTTKEYHDATPVYSPDTLLYGDYSLGRGNTIYGKLAKFRCRNTSGSFDSRDTVKNVTLTKANNTNRFTYWGVEWSNRGEMLSVRNAARGGGTWQATPPPPDGSTTYTSESDIYYYDPDLVMWETNHNSYSNNATSRIDGIKRYVFNELPGGGDAGEDLALSVKLDSFANCDVVFFNPSVGGGATGEYYDDDGNLLRSVIFENRFHTYSDGRDGVMYWFRTQKPQFLFCNSHAALREAGIKYYGNMDSAMYPSSPTGYSLMNDSVHPNKRGYAVMYRAIDPIFNF